MYKINIPAGYIKKFTSVLSNKLSNTYNIVSTGIIVKSDDLEKVDGNNGLLLSPHVDHLFDRGWIRFEADGTMITSPKLDPSVLPSWRIEPVLEKFPFNSIQIEYLAYHAESVFQK